MSRPRYALLFDGGQLERWHLRCLDRLEQWAELVGVIVASERPSRRGAAGRPRLMRSYAERVESRSRVDVSERFAQVARLSVQDVQRRDPEATLDFVLRLGRVSIPPELASAPRHGVWYFEHEGEGDHVPFFHEVYDNEDVTHAVLSTLDREDGGTAILEEGWFPTHKRSYPASRDRVEDAIAAWPARVCRRLADVEGDAVAPRRGAFQPPHRPERSVRFLRYRAALAQRRLALAWERLVRHPQWNIGVLDRPVGTLLAQGAYADSEIDWFPLRDREGFLADPFAIVRDGTAHILCEYFDYRQSKGDIRALDYTAEGFSTLTPALSLPAHMSYPYLIEDSNEIYCIPETAAAGEMALFRAAEFPRRWSKIAVLVADFPGLDPTVFRHDGRWWLMCTRKGAHEDVELWVWHAAELRGPWTEHARNPVKTDVRGARPAGPPFVHEGALYRPAQDCSRTYGGRITLQRVMRLTPTEFAEDPVTILEASPGSPFPCGPHTLTAVGDLVLVDGRRTVFVWAALRAFLRIWATHLAGRSRRGRAR